jgi:hypothetical protein
MSFREIITVYCENHMEYTAALCGGRIQIFGVLKISIFIISKGFAKFRKFVQLDVCF